MADPSKRPTGLGGGGIALPSIRARLRLPPLPPFRVLSRFSLARQILLVWILIALVGCTFSGVAVLGAWAIGQEFRTYESVAGEARLAAEINADIASVLLNARKYLATGAAEDLVVLRRFLSETRHGVYFALSDIQEPGRRKLVDNIKIGLDDFEKDIDRLAVLVAASERLGTGVLDRLGPQIRQTFTAIMEESLAAKDYQGMFAAGVIQEDFLTARLYLSKFLVSGKREAADRVESEFLELVPGLESLASHLGKYTTTRATSAGGLKQVQWMLDRYREAFAELRNIVEERNTLSTHTLAGDGERITGWAKELKANAVETEQRLSAEILAIIASQEITVLVAVVMALLLCIMIFLGFARSMAKNISALTAAMKSLAGGDTEIAVGGSSRGDEIVDMAKALVLFRDHALEKSRIEREVENQRRQIEAERIRVAGEQAQVVNIVGEGLRGLVGGDFTSRIDADMAEEYRGLKDDFNAAAEQLEGYIAERRRTEAKLDHMAHHDALTKLPNRLLLREHMETIRGSMDSTSFAILCVDLDGFKSVNDSLGHAAGDILLREVAARLAQCIRKGDLVARIGGDEFAIVQADVVDEADTRLLAVRILEAIGAPYSLAGHRAIIGTSIGIAISPRDGNDPEILLRHADLALYQAKREGRGVHCFYSPKMSTAAQARHERERDLRAALANGELELHYQPQVNVTTNAVVGFEALLRWHHPLRGVISPMEFIPIAEETGLIVRIGEWALRQACAMAQSWPRHLEIAVNVSVVQLKQRNFAETVVLALGATGLAPHRLVLEITESVLALEDGAIPKMLQTLRAMGVRIALDDFGTGYSSLSCLRTFPIDKIKIGRSFIRDLEDGGDDAAAIVRSVIALGNALRLAISAVGVESKKQHDIIRAEGCTEMQGHLVSKALPVEELEAMYLASNLKTASAT